MTDDRLNPLDPELEDKAYEVGGERPRDEQAAYIDQSDTDQLGSLSDVAIYEGELEAGVHDDLPGEPKAQNLELLTELELREGETDNPDEAAEEGLSYVPPIDPPVVPDADDPEGAQVAAGFGLSALDEPYDADHPTETLADEDEMSARVRDALRADSSTSRYADELAIGTRGGVVALRGVVDDMEDSENVLAVAGYVSGVVEVVDELTVRALEE